MKINWFLYAGGICVCGAAGSLLAQGDFTTSTFLFLGGIFIGIYGLVESAKGGYDA